MSINSLKFKINPKSHPKLLWGGSLVIGGLFYLKIWLPVTNIGIPCVIHELTGFYCPGCGVTRVVLSLLKLDFVQAFRFNPLLFMLVPLYAMYFITQKKQMRLIGNVIMVIMLIMTLTFGILRNIPIFDFLAPTVIR